MTELPYPSAPAPEAEPEGGTGWRGDHALQRLLVPIDSVAPHPENPRQGDVGAMSLSLERFGQYRPAVVQTSTRHIVAGSHMWKAAKALGWTHLAVLLRDMPEAEARQLMLADNRVADRGSYDQEALAQLVRLLAEADQLDPATGYDLDDLDDMLADLDRLGLPAPGGAHPQAEAEPEPEAAPPAPPRGRAEALRRAFGVPPFSVLDARSGAWQDLKRQWIDLGIEGEAGRAPALLGGALGTAGQGGMAEQVASGRQRVGAYGAQATTGLDGRLEYTTTTGATSIFDPVLAQLLLTWFCPPGGSVLDPFAGGSTRGLVAAHLGYRYTGIELRPEQVEANEHQARAVGLGSWHDAPGAEHDPDALTPVERRGEVWVKRDDLFTCGGVRGGKVRTCLSLAREALPGQGLITAGSRESPQVNIVAHVARSLGLPCRVHTPAGEPGPEVAAAVAVGAELVQHRPGYNTVIVARAREDAQASGWVHVPFGMECREAVEQTRRQVANLPSEVRRVVVPVGSGMSLAGVLWGLRDLGREDVRVLGVWVGANPSGRLAEYAPPGWQERCDLVEAGVPYGTAAEDTDLAGLALDPIYEAKCLPHLQAGDLLWVVGVRQTADGTSPGAARWLVGDAREAEALLAGEAYDMLLACPPYFDMERYSEDPADLSGMDPEAFRAAYREALAAAVAHLRPDTFAAIVVGEARSAEGPYHGLVPLTIEAMAAAGCAYYNEAVLVTPAGSLPVRAAKAMNASRKLGKTHQNVLVFVRGDWRKAASALPPLTVPEPEAEPEPAAEA